MGPLIVESSFPLHPCLGSVLGIAGMGAGGGQAGIDGYIR